MNNYQVYGLGTFTTAVQNVEADTPEEALEKCEYFDVSLCWHCAQELELDPDVGDFFVMDEEGNHLLEEGFMNNQNKQMLAMRKEIERLRKKLDEQENKQ